MSDDYVKRADVHKAFQPKYAPAINRTFAAMIDSVPAADVVEVVRCRECKHNITSSTRQFYQWCEEHHEYHVPNWFCADGERKDGGQDDV